MQNQKIKNGFSIIEIIMYVAILWIILTVVTNFSIDSLQEKSRQQDRQIVNQDTNFVIDKITYEIENAEKINQNQSIFGSATNTGKIVLNRKDGNVVTFSLSGTSVYFQENSDQPIVISSPDTEISSLNFSANKIEGSTPKKIQVTMHAKTKNTNFSVPYEEDFQTSIVSKNADSDGDGCLDVVDQFPLDENCCRDTDGDKICDKKDNCPLVNNMGQEDDDGDGKGDGCDDHVDTTHEDQGGGGSCVEGKKLAIWIDRNNNGEVDANDIKKWDIVAYSGDKSSTDNYNYFSYSAHPVNGPAPDPYESQVFFYEGSDGLSFNFFHNIDSDDQSEGSADNKVDWWIYTSGNNLADNVMLSDDNRELTEIFTDLTLEEKSYHGAFHYWYNTDGGVIWPFEGENYKIQVNVDGTGDLQNAAFYSANGDTFSLINEGIISSFIITYETYEDCRNDDDGDGVPDDEDICPGYDDNLDTDADGIPNDCDDGEEDSDGDGVSDNEDICPGYDDNLDTDNNSVPDDCDSGDGTIDYCAIETANGGNNDSTNIIGGMWEGIGSVDSCIYTCNYQHELWQTICQRFECFYTGNKNNFETSIDNNEYAGVGQIFSLESENMYWKKVFKLDVAEEALSKIDRFKFSLNYCHGGSRLSTLWLRGRCSNKERHLNGIFDGNQSVEMFNYATNSWDEINILETNSRNNKEIYAEFEYSLNLSNYINSNKEVTARIKFKASGAAWGHYQRWYILAPARYLFLDYFNLETHVQALSVCGDGTKEMDEQCDDGSQCSDGTDCTDFGNCKCVGIGDEECKPRNFIGNNCSTECLNENSVCGNNLTEENEECDDGNTVSGDGCDFTCKVETCGNGLVEASEECDFGTRCDLNWPYCTLNAECEGRGDEQCLMRDGDDDQCSQFCLAEICGNGRLEASEECDDGNLIDGDSCNSICRIEECLNGIVDDGEQCDDGNTFDDDNCNNICEKQECGDSIKNRLVEECDNGKQCGDDANTTCMTNSECLGLGDNLCKVRNGDGCNENCLIEFPVCGNNTIEVGEECDDSNLNDGDGCSHTCMTEYIVDYEITAPNNKAYLVLGTKQPHRVGLHDFLEFDPQQHNYPGSKVYQVEFNQLDEIISHILGASYQKIKTLDNVAFVAESLTPWLSYLRIIPQTYATYTNYGFITAQGKNKYLNHKFSFKINDNEYKTSESSPQRINYIKITWNGMPQAELYNNHNRYADLYVWKNNTWKLLDTEIWNSWLYNNNNRTLTYKLQNDLDSYLDANHTIHFMIETNKKGYNILATDFVKLEVNAYGYREGFE